VKLNDNFLAQMREATQLLQTSGPAAATAAIQRALHGTEAAGAATPDPATPAPILQPGELVDINPPTVGAVGAASAAVKDFLTRFRNPSAQKWKGASARQPIEDVEVDVDIAGKGKFLRASCTNHAGTRAYKLYIPSCYSDSGGEALPLVVMLHGCKQNPDDFAAGTGMNAIAEQNNCFVIYPAQKKAANGSNCWNWFKTEDQQRDQGEPSIIADITREVMRTYRIDAQRVYVAGLSAGGAMAAIMGATYPELYAAVGIHSGLAHGAANDLPSAFAAMRNGNGNGNGMTKAGPLGALDPLKARATASASRIQAIPAIVFHGDRDTTVHPCNGDQALAQCIGDGAGKRTEQQAGPGVKVEQGQVPQGRAYTRTIQHDSNGKAIAEHWLVHGAGHAWSGGTRNGSYTDPKGPDAAREMLRFFYTHAMR
jgi:poly(hydroxyalkanoate) depolymerase family esterase